MRPTWIVLGLVVGLGAVAYVKLKSKADGATPLARPAADAAPQAPVGRAGDAGPAAKPALASPAGTAPAPSAAGPEAQAAEIRARIVAAEAGKDVAGALALEAELDGTLRETDEARRHAVQRGLGLLKEAETKPAESLLLLDRARQDLSRGVDLPEMYDPTSGKPAEDRRRLLERIFAANHRVMTSASGGAKATTARSAS
jgi:hypothetical protein